MKKILSVLFIALLLNTSEIIASSNPLTLDEAINILKSENLEIKAADLDVASANQDLKAVSGKNWGKLDFVQEFANSNDAGNVFGFKLTSREADFGDFGAKEFMDNFMAGHPDYDTPPHNLNKPRSRDFFQSKVTYEVPLFTGFQLSSYESMMRSMKKMKTLEKNQVVNEKIYQIRKSFYDMALLENSINNLLTISNNIKTLEEMTKSMLEVGYAKKVDLLEVQSKRGNVERLLSNMEANKQLLYQFIGFLLNMNVTEIEVPSQAVPMPNYSNEEILNNNLDIQRASTGLEVRKSMIDVSKSVYYPMIGAFAEGSTADNSFLGDANDHSAYTVGARLTWNIFNGGVDNANLEKAQVEHLKTKTQVQLAKKGIELKILKIRTEISSFDSDIASLKNELKLANEIYKNYEGRYLEKLSSMSDVIIKQSMQIQKILELQMIYNKRNERIFALEKLANGEQN
jgi:outer membrane protein TolC